MCAPLGAERAGPPRGRAVLTGGMTNVLILGGTAWLGALIAREWRDAGAAVTCLARGSSGSAPEGVDFVRADRTDPRRLRPESPPRMWDEVVELAWDPVARRRALAALADRARHWTLVSSVSVYADGEEIGADESARLLEPDDPSDYGKAKVAAERASAAALGDRLLIVRPGLIVGPGDRSDRFGYWPAASRSRRKSGCWCLPSRERGRRSSMSPTSPPSSGGRGRAGRRARWMPSASPSPLRELLTQAADAAGFTGEWVEASAAAPSRMRGSRTGRARGRCRSGSRPTGRASPAAPTPPTTGWAASSGRSSDTLARTLATSAPAASIASGGRGSPARRSWRSCRASADARRRPCPCACEADRAAVITSIGAPP